MNNADYKELAEPLSELLPKKDLAIYLGSTLATRQSVTDDRMSKLSIYLSALMEEKQLSKCQQFFNFIDEKILKKSKFYS